MTKRTLLLATAVAAFLPSTGHAQVRGMPSACSADGRGLERSLPASVLGG